MTCLLVNRTTRRYFGLAYWIKLERILWNRSGVAYLVLRLGHEPSPSKVVRLSLPSPPILDLETADRYGSALMVTGEAESGVSRGSMIRSWDSKYARKISRTLNVFDKGHVDAERQLKVKANKRFSRNTSIGFFVRTRHDQTRKSVAIFSFLRGASVIDTPRQRSTSQFHLYKQETKPILPTSPSDSTRSSSCCPLSLSPSYFPSYPFRLMLA
jgi:hypothetical protein